MTIEDADVNLEKLKIAGSAQTSTDVVVVDREQQRSKRVLGLSTDVRILFGKNVRLAGFGLESTVGGELRVTEKPNEVSRAVGEILVAGDLRGLGRKPPSSADGCSTRAPRWTIRNSTSSRCARFRR